MTERAVATIATLWKVKPVSLSTASLIDALRSRLLDIKRDARLRAKLKLTSIPTQEYLGIDMLESVSQALQGADDVTAMSHPTPLTNVCRDDVVRPGLTPEAALEMAPESEDQRFLVPKILGEE